MLRFLLLLPLLFLALPLSAQVTFDCNNLLYQQDFDGLTPTATNCAAGVGVWANNTTIPGWFAATDGATTTGSNPNTFRDLPSNGTCNTGGLMNFGMDGSNDRALGQINSGNSEINFGVRFVNNTGFTITELSVFYTGEQWRHGDNATDRDRLDFQYKIGPAGSITLSDAAGWIDFDALDFESQNIAAPINTALDGNNSSNRLLRNSSITSLAIANGQEIWFRWKWVQIPGTDDGLGIDDFQVNVTVDEGTIAPATSTICPGSSTPLLTLTIAGSPNILFWEQANNPGFSPRSVIPASAFTTLQRTNVTNTTYYRAVLQSAAGCPIVQTTGVEVAVDAGANPGTIATAQTVCTGSVPNPLTLSGHIGTIQTWESSTDNFVGNTLAIPTATNAIFAPAALTQRTCFRAVVQGGGGCPPAASPSTCIDVSQPTVAGTIASAQTICFATTPSSLLLSGGSGSIVRWESSIDNFANTTTIANTNINQNIGVLSTTTCFRSVQKDGNCSEATATAVCITVLPQAVGGTVSPSQTVCRTAAPNLLTLAGHTGTVVRWESSTDNFASNVVPIVNTNLTFLPPVLAVNTSFRAILSVNPTCVNTTSVAANITLDNPSVAGTVTGVQTICAGSVPPTPLALAGGTGAVLRWESSVDNFASTTIAINTATNVNYSPSALNQSTCFRSVQKNGACNNAPSNSICITVDPATVAGTIGGGATTVCDNINAGLLTLNGNTGQVLRWESSTDDFVAVTTPVPVTTQTLDPGLVTVNTCYRAVVQSGICNVRTTPSTCLMPIVCIDAALATIATTPADLCLSPVTITVTGTDTRFSTTNGVFLSRSDIVLDPIGFGSNVNIVSDTELNFRLPPTTPTGTWWLIIRNGGDQLTTARNFPIPLQLNVTSTGGVISGEIVGAATVCAGNHTGILTLNGATGPVLRWESSTSSFQRIDTIANTTIQQDYKDLFVNTFYRAVVDGGGCEVYSIPAQITMNPLALPGNIFSNQQACGNSTAGGLLLIGNTGTIDRWESSIDSFAVDIKPLVNKTMFQSYNIRQTTWFRSVITGDNCISYSRPVRIKLDSLPITGFLANDTAVCSSQPTGSLTLSKFSGDILHWESTTDNFATITTISVTDTTYLFSGLTTNTEYRVLLSRNGTCKAYSQSALVTVIPAAIGGTLAADATLCGSPNGATLTLTGQVGTIFGWESSTDNFVTVATKISNTTDTYNYKDLTQNTCYRVRVGDGSKCPPSYSNIACITYIPTDFAGKIAPANQSICVGNPILPLGLQTFMGMIVRWESYTDCVGFSDPTPVADTNPMITPTPPDTTTCYRAVVNDPTCGDVFSAPSRIQVSHIRFNPGVTQVDQCISLGSIDAKAYGGLGRFNIYEIDPPVRSPNISGLYVDMQPGSYRITAKDPINQCTADTLVEILPTEDTVKITNIVNITPNSVNLFWTDIQPSGSPRYNLRYRVKGSDDWTTFFNIRFPQRQLSNLQSATDYEVQLSYRCPNGIETPWTSDTVFTTLPDGDCASTPYGKVGGLYHNQLTATTVVIHFNRLPSAVGYLVSLGLASLPPNSWPTYPICDPQDTLLVKGLVQGRAYRYRVRAHCVRCNSAGGLGMTAQSQIFEFATPFFRESETVDMISGKRVETLSLYPNPSRGEVTLSFAAEEAGTRSLELFDLTGRKVDTKEIETLEGGNEINLSYLHLSSGVYMLRLSNGKESYTTKLILE